MLQLSADHLVWPLGAAGETLQHMVFGRPGEQEPAYLQALGEWADELHPTNAGYAKVSERFRRTLREARIA